MGQLVKSVQVSVFRGWNIQLGALFGGTTQYASAALLSMYKVHTRRSAPDVQLLIILTPQLLLVLMFIVDMLSVVLKKLLNNTH